MQHFENLSHFSRSLDELCEQTLDWISKNIRYSWNLKNLVFQDDVMMHLTNYAITKHSDDFIRDDERGHKRFDFAIYKLYWQFVKHFISNDFNIIYLRWYTDHSTEYTLQSSLLTACMRIIAWSILPRETCIFLTRRNARASFSVKMILC